MIIQEQFSVGSRNFVRTYSDKGVLIHGGFPEADYEESLDPAEFGRTYTETDTPIDGADETGDKAEAFDILMGDHE